MKEEWNGGMANEGRVKRKEMKKEKNRQCLMEKGRRKKF